MKNSDASRQGAAVPRLRRPWRLAAWFALATLSVGAGYGAILPGAGAALAAAREGQGASSRPDRILLTWSGDPATSVSVTWRTDTTVARGLAQLALAGASPRVEAEAKTVDALTEPTEVVGVRGVAGGMMKVHYHSVTFTGLMPDTKYLYRVGDGARWSEWFQFRTAADGPQPLEFLYLGDAQNDIGPLWSRVIREAYATAPRARFLLHAGDLVNQAHSDEEWGEWFSGAGHIFAMIPSLPLPGNHEYADYPPQGWGETRSRRLSVFWQPQFTLPRNGAPGISPETNYWLDVQGVRVVVLNSNEDVGRQAAWLEAVLSSSPPRWIIVAHHHPVFSSARERDNRAVRETWQPIFERFGVDLVLQGHDHVYARGTAAPAAQADGGAGRGKIREVGTGPVYVVSVAGRKMYEFQDDGWSRHGADLHRWAENTQLFQVVRIEGNRLRFRAHLATGEVYDAFTLEKRADGAKRLVEEEPEVNLTLSSAPAGGRLSLR